MSRCLKVLCIIFLWSGLSNTEAQEKNDSSLVIDFSALPFEQSIKTIKGNGTRKLAVFYEIDCAYCKSLEKYELSRIDDVTIYNFLFVNEGKNSQSWKKAESIWCSDDINKAWNNFITKDYLVNSMKTCDAPLDKNKALALKLGIRGTPTLYFLNGTKAAGLLTAKDIEQRFLDATFYSE